MFMNEISQQMKYERDTVNLQLNVTLTGIVPLDILYLDTFISRLLTIAQSTSLTFLGTLPI